MPTNEQQRSVLIVDDDSMILDMYLQMFQKENITAAGVHNGQEALDHIAEHGCSDVLLVDLAMPKMDGLTFLERLHDQHQCEASKIVVLTNNDSEKEVAEARQYGIDDYIVKVSKTPEEVVERARELCCQQR